MTTPSPDPTTIWFPVSQELRRLSIASLGNLYGLLALLPAMLAFTGLVSEERALTTVSLVAAGTAALAGVVHTAVALHLIRRSHRVLGVESRGLWWHDSDGMVFLDWDAIQAVQLHTHRSRYMYTGTALDLFPLTPLPLRNPRGPRDRHRIELTRGPTVPPGVPLFATPHQSGHIARTIATLRPDKQIGPA